MAGFDPQRLKQLRQQKPLSTAEMAGQLGISVAQLHRLEKGERRLTVDTLLDFCRVLGVNVSQLFASPVEIPITGVINEDFEVLPPPPDSNHSVWIPPGIPNSDAVAAVRWDAGGGISRISGHLAFYYKHETGIPETAWENRCLILRADKSQCIGWLIKQDGSMHIDNPNGASQFNVDVVWASPIVAVVPPLVL